MLLDLRDGLRQVDLGFEGTGATFARPLGKDKLFVFATSPAGVSQAHAWFYDAHSGPGTKGANYADNISQLQVNPNKGVAYATKTPSAELGHLYYAAW